jgi:hypothetical protein
LIAVTGSVRPERSRCFISQGKQALTAGWTIRRFLTALLFQGVDLVDSSLMSPAVKVGIQPNFNQTLNALLAHKVSREAKDIDVVVTTAHFGRHFIMTGCSSNSWYFVGSDRHTDAGPTNQNASIGLMSSNLMRDRCGNIRVIDRF